MTDEPKKDLGTLYTPCDDCKHEEDSEFCQTCEFEQTLNDLIKSEADLDATLKRERELMREVCELKYVTADVLPDDYAKRRGWPDDLFGKDGE